MSLSESRADMDSLVLVGLGAGLMYLKQRRGFNSNHTPRASTLDHTEKQLHAANNVPDDHLPSKHIDKVRNSTPAHSGFDNDSIHPDVQGAERRQLLQLGEDRREAMRNGVEPPSHAIKAVEPLGVTSSHYD